MKALTTAGLTKLIQLIKSSFISVDDTVEASTVTLADVATTGDYDDLINKPTIPSIDNNSITKNSQNQIQASGVIEKNAGGVKYDWIGTLSQYTTQAVATTHPDWVCYITDDDTSGAYDAYTKAETNSLISSSEASMTDLISSSISTLVGSMYPVGSIYIGTTQVCPIASLITGSTWELVATDRVLQGAGTRGSVGDTVNESLPNITGGIGLYNSMQTFGATSWENTGRSSTENSVSGTNQAKNSGYIDFDASRCSSTYQDNAPVQQNAYLVNIWERTA